MRCASTSTRTRLPVRPRCARFLGAFPPAILRAILNASRWKRIVARISASRRSRSSLTNGVDEAIHVLFETFLEAGDELLLPVPTYTMYEVYASATDARVVAGAGGRRFAVSLRAPLDCDHCRAPRSLPSPIPTALRVRSRHERRFSNLLSALRTRWCWWTRPIFISTAKRSSI